MEIRLRGIGMGGARRRPAGRVVSAVASSRRSGHGAGSRRSAVNTPATALAGSEVGGVDRDGRAWVPNPLPTAKQIADEYGIECRRMWAMCRDGLIPAGVAVKLGRQWRINRARWEEFLSSGGQGLPGGWRREVIQ